MILADVLFLLLVIGLGGLSIGVLISKYKKAKTSNQLMLDDIRQALFSNDKLAIENVIILYGKRMDKSMREELKHRAVMLEFEKDIKASPTETTNPDIKIAKLRKVAQ
jgi:hypothetical protein